MTVNIKYNIIPNKYYIDRIFNIFIHFIYIIK